LDRYLIDTNIVIYTLQPKKEHKKVVNFMDKIYDDDKVDVLYSVVVEAEVFSRELTQEVKEKVDILLAEARIVRIDSDIARRAGQIRVKGKALGYNIKLPDVLIAATAIIEDAILVTHNPIDFRKINQFENINIFDPMEDYVNYKR